VTLVGLESTPKGEIGGFTLHRNNFFIGLVLLAVSLTGCSSADKLPGASAANPDTLAQFAGLDFSSPPVVHHQDDGRVQVELSSAWSDDGRLVVRAVFTPDDPGYHLYGSQMAKTGVQGIGRPTLLEVSGDPIFAEVGPLVWDKNPIEHLDKMLNLVLPLYPDGPVTLYLPLNFQTPPQGPTQIPVQLTYMACSKQSCYSPIEQHVEQIEVTAPAVAP